MFWIIILLKYRKVAKSGFKIGTGGCMQPPVRHYQPKMKVVYENEK